MLNAKGLFPFALFSALSGKPRRTGPEEKKRVVCFDCQGSQRVSRSASSTQCRLCGAFIDLRNLEVRTRMADRIRTRGDVIVHKKGALLGTVVHCGNLTLQGRVSGGIRAQETVEIDTECKIMGEIRCRRLVVARKAEVQCRQPVHAEEMLVRGHLSGTVFVSGIVLIDSHGTLDGSLTAGALSVRPGGILNAAVEVTGDKGQGKPKPPPDAGLHFLNAALL